MSRNLRIPDTNAVLLRGVEAPAKKPSRQPKVGALGPTRGFDLGMRAVGESLFDRPVASLPSCCEESVPQLKLDPKAQVAAIIGLSRMSEPPMAPAERSEAPLKPTAIVISRTPDPTADHVFDRVSVPRSHSSLAGSSLFGTKNEQVKRSLLVSVSLGHGTNVSSNVVPLPEQASHSEDSSSGYDSTEAEYEELVRRTEAISTRRHAIARAHKRKKRIAIPALQLREPAKEMVDLAWRRSHVPVVASESPEKMKPVHAFLKELRGTAELQPQKRLASDADKAQIEQNQARLATALKEAETWQEEQKQQLHAKETQEKGRSAIISGETFTQFNRSAALQKSRTVCQQDSEAANIPALSLQASPVAMPASKRLPPVVHGEPSVGRTVFDNRLVMVTRHESSHSEPPVDVKAFSFISPGDPAKAPIPGQTKSETHSVTTTQPTAPTDLAAAAHASKTLNTNTSGESILLASTSQRQQSNRQQSKILVPKGNVPSTAIRQDSHTKDTAVTSSVRHPDAKPQKNSWNFISPQPSTSQKEPDPAPLLASRVLTNKVKPQPIEQMVPKLTNQSRSVALDRLMAGSSSPSPVSQQRQTALRIGDPLKPPPGEPPSKPTEVELQKKSDSPRVNRSSPRANGTGRKSAKQGPDAPEDPAAVQSAVVDPKAPLPRPEGQQYAGVAALDVWKRVYLSRGSCKVPALRFRRRKDLAHRLMAIVVAVASYSDERLYPLHIADHDAEAVATMLEAFGYSVTRLFGRHAKVTKANVLSSIRDIVALCVEPEYMCFVFVVARGSFGSLHGFEQPKHYFLLQDTKLSHISRHSVITGDEITELKNSTSGVQPILFADLHPLKVALKGIDPSDVGRAFALIRCGAKQHGGDFAFRYPTQAVGAFTWYFLKGLQGAAVRGGRITPGLLNAYVHAKLLSHLAPKDLERAGGEMAFQAAAVKSDDGQELVGKANTMFRFKTELILKKNTAMQTRCRFVVEVIVDVSYMYDAQRWLKQWEKKIDSTFYPIKNSKQRTGETKKQSYGPYRCKAKTMFRTGQFFLLLDPQVVGSNLGHIVREGSCDDEIKSLTGAAFSGSGGQGGFDQTDADILEGLKRAQAKDIAENQKSDNDKSKARLAKGKMGFNAAMTFSTFASSAAHFSPKYKLVHSQSFVQVATTYLSRFDLISDESTCVFVDEGDDLMKIELSADAEAAHLIEEDDPGEEPISDKANNADDAPPVVVDKIPKKSIPNYKPGVDFTPETRENASNHSVDQAIVPTRIYDTYFKQNVNKVGDYALFGAQEKIFVVFDGSERDFLQMQKHWRLGTFQTKFHHNLVIQRVELQAGPEILFFAITRLQALFRSRRHRRLMLVRMDLARRELSARVVVSEKEVTMREKLITLAAVGLRTTLGVIEQRARLQWQDLEFDARCDIIEVWIRWVMRTQQPLERQLRVVYPEQRDRLCLREAMMRQDMFIRYLKYANLLLGAVILQAKEKDQRIRVQAGEEGDRGKVKNLMYADLSALLNRLK